MTTPTSATLASDLLPRDGRASRGVILVVDDEPAMRSALREVLTRAGWSVALAADPAEAVARLRQSPPPSLLLSDFRLPGATGLDLLREARRLFPSLAAILMTAYGTVEDAVDAMKAGAGDFLLKPFSMEAVTRAVDRVIAAAACPAPAPPSHAPGMIAGPADDPTGAAEGIVAAGSALRAILRVANDVADADATVLLSGESGTGKEVVARFIHRRSGRAGAFVAVNCAALPDGLLESELFGHEKGAFTGAILTRKGRFEQAQRGTLLLDEISEMPLALQAKLLRVLQEREIVPVGGNETIRLDVRVIATTNRDLERDVDEGRFRQDLFYRLNVIHLPLPPLRDRPEEIAPLAAHFLARYCRAGRPARRLDPEALRWLERHPWPGNVRELENIIERACLLARGEAITLGDLRMDALAPASPSSAPFGTAACLASAGAAGRGLSTSAPFAGAPRQFVEPGRFTAAGRGGAASLNNVLTMDETLTLDEMERRMILRTLEQTGGNRTRAADLLGVSVRTIRNKLHQYGLATEEAV